MDPELTGVGGFEGVELLQKLHLFRRLSFDETTRLGGIIQYLDLPADSLVIDQNALGDALFVIARGEVRVTRETETPGQLPAAEEIGLLKEGELFGEMSLIDDVLTSARVTTTISCRLLKLPRDRFEALLAADEKLAIKVYRSFCSTLSDRLRRTSSLLAHSQALPLSVR